MPYCRLTVSCDVIRLMMSLQVYVCVCVYNERDRNSAIQPFYTPFSAPHTFLRIDFSRASERGVFLYFLRIKFKMASCPEACAHYTGATDQRQKKNMMLISVSCLIPRQTSSLNFFFFVILPKKQTDKQKRSSAAISVSSTITHLEQYLINAWFILFFCISKKN